MRNFLSSALVILSVLILSSGCSYFQKKQGGTMKTKLDTISYIIGTNIGSNLKQNGLEVNNEVLIKGIEESMKGDKHLLNDETVKKVMTEFQKEMMAKQDAKMKGESEKNKQAGIKYLADNKSKQGVITLPSGLQYKVVKLGNGPKPKETDVVKVNYQGALIDGKVFDSSYERKEPTTFPVNQVIKGWTEALQLMPVGSTWEVYVPSELGYGDRGTGNIPAGSTLIFKVELLSIEKAEPKKK